MQRNNNIFRVLTTKNNTLRFATKPFGFTNYIGALCSYYPRRTLDKGDKFCTVKIKATS